MTKKKKTFNIKKYNEHLIEVINNIMFVLPQTNF